MAHSSEAHDKTQIHLPRKKLRKLMLLENSCFCEVEDTTRISLSPAYIGNVSQGLKDTLNSQLYKYNVDLCGIVVSIERVKVLSQTANIFGDEPNLFLDATVSYVIFKPEIGVRVSGKVNKVSRQHVGCVVHDVFNASVRNSRGSSDNNFGNISIGDSITFTVTNVEPQNDLLSIKGEFDSPSESSGINHNHSDKKEPLELDSAIVGKKHKKKKNKQRNEEVEAEAQDHHGNNEVACSKQHHKKKKKKKLNTDLSKNQ